jgi:tagatose-6-phosphate ketose/aldose isomerase
MHSMIAHVSKNKGYTWSEISQQMDLWSTTSEKVDEAVNRYQLGGILSDARVLMTGAGSSFYAASAIAAAWPRATAVASTDLLIDMDRYLTEVDVVISLGRSGNSPESIATVEQIHKSHPLIRQLAITCHAAGALAQSPLVYPVLLDARTNDKSLVMTSSFSNLVIAGLCLANPLAIDRILPSVIDSARYHLAAIDETVQRVAAKVRNRIVLLCSSPLYPWAQEGALKATEMVAGKYPAMAETFLGLRHGPMTFLEPDTVVLCLLSSLEARRHYELDLVRELNTKNLGYIVGIGVEEKDTELFREHLPAIAPTAPDALRAPFEMMGAQLLGYRLSLQAGINPDNPSPDGVINRVVQGVRIYESFVDMD